MPVSLPGRDDVDDAFRSATGDRVGISDDFTSTADTGGDVEVGISDDWTSTSDSGGVMDTLRTGGGLLQDGTRRTAVQGPMSAVASLRAGEPYAVSDEEAGEAFGDLDDGLTSTVDRGVEAVGLEDSTVVDYGRSGVDMFVTEGVRNVHGFATGIDYEEGDTDFETDRWAALDVGLLGGGAAVGGAVRGGARGADEAGGLLSRVRSGGDDAATATTPSGSAADDAASQASDPLALDTSPTEGGLLARFRGGDDAAQASTPSGQAADQPSALPEGSPDPTPSGSGPSTSADPTPSGSGASSPSASADPTPSGSGGGSRPWRADGGSAPSGSAPSSPSGASRPTGGRPQGSRPGSAPSSPSTTSPSWRQRLTPSSRTGQAGAILGGGFLGALGAEQAGLLDWMGGALPGSDDEEIPVETEDGQALLLHLVEELEPTEEHPGGGQLREVERIDPEGSFSESDGYTVILDFVGNSVTMLGPDGEPMQASVSPREVEEAARSAETGYYGGNNE